MNLRRTLLTVAASALLVPVPQVTLTTPAAAHPFGPPATARIDVHGTEVEIIWRAAEDDWVALGQSLGAFEDPATGPVDTTLTGEQKLARSGQVRDYLTERIAVRQAGELCATTVLPLADLLRDGARLRFDCPLPVTDVEVRLDALTDLHTAYRTVLTADTAMVPAQALFTSARTTHQVSLTDGGTASGSLTAVWAVAAGLAVAGGAAVSIAWRTLRRRRRQ